MWERGGGGNQVSICVGGEGQVNKYEWWEGVDQVEASYICTCIRMCMCTIYVRNVCIN